MEKLISSNEVYISLVFHKIETGTSLPVWEMLDKYNALFSNKLLDTSKDG